MLNYPYSHPDSAVRIYVNERRGCSTRLPHLQALALPFHRISNSIAHAE